jgi:hypothetical protein
MSEASSSRRDRASATEFRPVLHREVKPKQLAEPLMLRNNGQPLVE